MMTTKATVIENKAGYLYGNIASLFSRISTQTIGPNSTHSIAVSNPAAPPIKAPLVVSRDQYMEKKRIGKLTLAAIAKARPTMYATFCFSKVIPSRIAAIPSMMVLIRETITSFFFLNFTMTKKASIKIMGNS